MPLKPELQTVDDHVLQGRASADHTTLLLNCYTKLKAVDKLDAFLKGSGAADGTGPLKFDVETAVKVCMYLKSCTHKDRQRVYIFS